MARLDRVLGFLTQLSRLHQWLILIIASVLLALLINGVGLAAGWMLGPMFAGIALALTGSQIKLPKWSYLLAQALLGCLIAKTLTHSILSEIFSDWLLFFSVIISIMVLSWGLGFVMARLHVIPSSVAIWGASPGAAGAMVVMSKEFGADARLVAFMQYLRVLLVVIVASLVASATLSGNYTHQSLFAGWFVTPNWFDVEMTLLVAVGGIVIGRIGRVPAGAMLVPMILAAFLHLNGYLTIDLPQLLLILSYLVIGWVIGLGFDQQTLKASLYALPRVLIANVILIFICALLGVGVSYWFHVDLLSAYLATSPGGANVIAIIALSTPVNVPFIMALQTCRLIIIILFGPWIARFMAKWVH
ncbi:MAG: hypothetical protein CENE_03056 [Candidatus Celerinatantimonas neptuna]|nr:MAG: hypothetical protein CENE_03056 [Candidatus Celerinatantimonas neptuna]